MTPLTLPIFVPIDMGGFVDEPARPPSSPMRCTSCDRVQDLNRARIWNRGTCYACAGALANVATGRER